MHGYVWHSNRYVRDIMNPIVRLRPLAVLVALSSSAWADGQEVDQEAPPQPPPPAMRPVYTAPLSQTTQSTFVPQSVALSGPEEIDNFDENRPVPDGYTRVQRKRKGLIIGGAVTLGATWGVSAMVAAIGEDLDGPDSDVEAMWIPVAGPFMTLAQTDSATLKVFLVGLGGAQLAGAIMLYYGLTSTKHVLVRNDLIGSLQVGPMAGNGSQGVVLSGRLKPRAVSSERRRKHPPRPPSSTMRSATRSTPTSACRRPGRRSCVARPAARLPADALADPPPARLRLRVRVPRPDLPGPGAARLARPDADRHVRRRTTGARSGTCRACSCWGASDGALTAWAYVGLASRDRVLARLREHADAARAVVHLRQLRARRPAVVRVRLGDPDPRDDAARRVPRASVGSAAARGATAADRPSIVLDALARVPHHARRRASSSCAATRAGRDLTCLDWHFETQPIPESAVAVVSPPAARGARRRRRCSTTSSR